MAVDKEQGHIQYNKMPKIYWLISITEFYTEIFNWIKENSKSKIPYKNVKYSKRTWQKVTYHKYHTIIKDYIYNAQSINIAHSLLSIALNLPILKFNIHAVL